MYTNIYERKAKGTKGSYLVEETRCDRCLHVLESTILMKEVIDDDYECSCDQRVKARELSLRLLQREFKGKESP